MFSFLKNIRSEKGSMLLPLMGMVILGGFIYLVSNWQELSLKAIKTSEEGMEFQIEFYSASDTLFFAYKQEEQRYIKELATCNEVRPFIQALKEGSACTTDVTVFKNGAGDTNSLFQFDSAGCVIKKDSSSCSSSTSHILSIKSTDGGAGNLNPFHYYDYDFYIFGIVPEKNVIEFLAITTDITQQKRIIGGKRKRTFALVDNLRNIAHIEADGRVTEESPSPISRCAGLPWQTLKSFNPATLECEEFKILGGAEGLAFYNGRYFGFRPADAQVFDLLSTTSNNEIKVEEDGKIAGVKIFPAYSKEALFNVNDITVIDESVYYVAGNGGDSHIGVVDLSLPTKRRTVCKVGEMGWGQSYDGILALSRSQDLSDTQIVGNSATFYLKSSGGDLITIMAVVNSSNGYDCYGLKDYNLQEIEYRRTYGFDRTEDNTSMYYY